MNVVNFYANDYGKVYRSCGNCRDNCARSVHMEGVTAVNGGELMGINTNLGDKVCGHARQTRTRVGTNTTCPQATYSNNCFPKTECQAYEGCDKSNGECEPSKLGTC